MKLSMKSLYKVFDVSLRFNKFLATAIFASFALTLLTMLGVGFPHLDFKALTVALVVASLCFLYSAFIPAFNGLLVEVFTVGAIVRSTAYSDARSAPTLRSFYEQIITGQWVSIHTLNPTRVKRGGAMSTENVYLRRNEFQVNRITA